MDIGVGSYAFCQGIVPTQELSPYLLMSSAFTGMFFTTSTTWESHIQTNIYMHTDVYIYISVCVCLCVCVYIYV